MANQQQNVEPLKHLYKIINVNDAYIDELKQRKIQSITGLTEEECTYLDYHNYLIHYKYNSLVVINSNVKFEGIIPDDILIIIAQHDVLIIDKLYTPKLDNLPNNIKLLIICSNPFYIHHLDNLPVSLEHLLINVSYNKPLDNLPNGLKTLDLIGFYNLELDNLPSSLKKLVVGGRYNQPFLNLPIDLEELMLSEYYQVELINLPPKLKILHIGSDYNLPLTNLPDSIEILSIEGCPAYIDKLPEHLKIFDIGLDANFMVVLTDNIEEINFCTSSMYLLNKLLNIHMPINLKRIHITPILDYNFNTRSYEINENEYKVLNKIKVKYSNYEVNFKKSTYYSS